VKRLVFAEPAISTITARLEIRRRHFAPRTGSGLVFVIDTCAFSSG
jgi:hypothetical protein